jgi:glycosyltransferase involved in cell wall biosynthesis
VPAVCVVEEGFERSMEWTTAGMPSALRRWLIGSERRRIGALHRSVARRGGRFVVISDEEREWLARSVPRELITVIPHGVDCGYFEPVDAAPEYDIGIFGQLGEPRVYEPAAEMHALLSARPAGEALRWAFVGRHPAPALTRLQSERVTVTGQVPDVRPYYARTRVAVIPSMVGTGVKTTVLQAWAMGRPVVATQFALNGLPARDGENVLVARDVEGLAEHAARLLASPGLYARLADEGLRTVRSERDTRRLGEDFADVCAAAMEGAARRELGGTCPE